MVQSNLYKRSNKIDYLGGMPGARINDDIIAVRVNAGILDISDRSDRVLGNVDITSLPEPLMTEVAKALASEGTDHLLVQQNDPLDVSASTVPTEEQGPVSIEDSSGSEIDPATEETLASLADALSSSGSDSFLIDSNEVIQVNDKSRSHHHRVESRTVEQGEIYIVKEGEEWNVNNLTVNGQLDVEGTLSYYGTIDGSGEIKGSGTIRSKE